jgi:hypothetical protein
MRFADEPAERVPSRQITRSSGDDRHESFTAVRGEFDEAVAQLSDVHDDEPEN